MLRERSSGRRATGRWRLVWLAAGLVLCLLGIGARARAAGAPPEPPHPTASDGNPPVSVEPPPSDAAAEAHVAYANQLFQLGLYVDAGGALRRAYERTPKPIYLFNAGQSYRKGSRPVDALDMYERFIAVAPEHPLSGEARGHIQTIQALLQQQHPRELSVENLSA